MGCSGGIEKNRVYLVDFGTAKRYRDTDGKHMTYKEGRRVKTSPRYLSINAHLQVRRSRRDDLISLGYMLVHLVQGRLPWQDIKDRYKIQHIKEITPIHKLCLELPSEFATYLNYCHSLRFEEDPDYLFLEKLFRAQFEGGNFTPDDLFDWNLAEHRYPPPPENYGL